MASSRTQEDRPIAIGTAPAKDGMPGLEPEND
jgi:hypothetical protein